MNNSKVFLGVLILVIGISMLFDIDIFRILFPLLLIWAGVRLIWGKNSPSFISKSEGNGGDIKRVMVLSEMNQKVQEDNFESGEFVAVLGGGEIDLTAVKTKSKQIKLDLVAILGGIKVIVPPTWAIHSEGVGILGGFNDSITTDGKKTVDVEVKGVAVLGGVYIVS